MKQYVLDGREIHSLETFAQHFSDRVLAGHQWRGHLDAFNDILAGGFGTPDEGFVLVWEHADVSRLALCYDETIRHLEARLLQCHPSNRERVAAELAAARAHQGPTVFDWLIEIIQDHGPGGAQSGDGVMLVLR